MQNSLSSLGDASPGIIDNLLHVSTPRSTGFAGFEDWVKVLLSVGKVPRTPELESTEKARRFQWEHVNCGMHFAFIRLGDNLIGSAHYSCAEGDNICLLAGSLRFC